MIWRVERDGLKIIQWALRMDGGGDGGLLIAEQLSGSEGYQSIVINRAGSRYRNVLYSYIWGPKDTRITVFTATTSSNTGEDTHDTPINACSSCMSWAYTNRLRPCFIGVDYLDYVQDHRSSRL